MWTRATLGLAAIESDETPDAADRDSTKSEATKFARDAHAETSSAMSSAMFIKETRKMNVRRERPSYARVLERTTRIEFDGVKARR